MDYLLRPYNWDFNDPNSIPNMIIQHLYLVGTAMLIALIIAIPLGLLAARYRVIYTPIVLVADILYTIPGIALIGLLLTITRISAATVIIPLVLYAQLVLIRNTVTAINSIDPRLLEVGRAMGMTSWQLFWRVTFPLALPIVVAGIRIATVTSIGIASLASLASQGGLGDLIFNNITIASRSSQSAVIAGAILMALLAIIADLLLLGLQTLLNRGRGALVVA